MQHKLGTPYEEYLYSRIKTEPDPEVDEGSSSSGFWGKPVPDLDPRLIDPITGNFRADIREEILNRLYGFWSKLYAEPETWSTVWCAGSALSHQYMEHEQPDLDILIGVDYDKFYAANIQFAGTSQGALSERFNDEFRRLLDPETANLFGGFEVTFYVNPGATNITDINPYAAFNLSDNTWTVSPVDVPPDWDPRTYFPQEWWKTIDAEIDNARLTVHQYDSIADQVRRSKPGSLMQMSGLAQLRGVAKRATDQFMDIHSKRKLAFSPQGAGYFDYFNLRWQAHKKAGTVKALHDIAVVNQEATSAQDAALYGGPVDSATKALLKAQLWNQTYGSPAWYRKRLQG